MQSPSNSQHKPSYRLKNYLPFFYGNTTKQPKDQSKTKTTTTTTNKTRVLKSIIINKRNKKRNKQKREKAQETYKGRPIKRHLTSQQRL